METLRERVSAWLREDETAHDVTAAALVPDGVRGSAVIRAKEAGVVAGLDVAAAVFAAASPDACLEPLVADGDAVSPGTEVARLAGPLRALLAAERTALNVLQRMGGVATLTARFVAAVRGTEARILVTRKTMPGLRDLDVAAVRAGGADAHRLSLADRVLVKENHLTAARLAGRARTMGDVAALLTGPAAPGVPVGIEVTGLSELREALVPGVAVVLLDNFTPELCREAVAIRDAWSGAADAGASPELEASGGITLENVAEYARSGVERISTGAPTHSARALDLSMILVPGSSA